MSDKPATRLIAIDGNSLMYRAFYALPSMTTRDGVPTGALHGFLGMLIKLLDYSPSHLVVAFDMHTPTFRHKEYSEYKAGRRETPDDLRTQFPIIKQLLQSMNICVCECEGFEADDILGTYSRLATEAGINSLLVTGDRDALQLVNSHVHVLMTKKGISNVVEYDDATIMSEYGLTPPRMVDLKGLMGDSSDNLPGVYGVGEKTALKLLEKYGTLEDTLTRGAVEEKGALQKRLTEFADDARMSYRLGTIITNAPLENAIEKSEFTAASMLAALSELANLQLFSISDRLKKCLENEILASTAAPEVHADFTCTHVDISDLNELCRILEAKKTDTFSFNISDNISFAFSQNVQYDICLSGTLLSPGLPAADVFATLSNVFCNADIKKITFDAKNAMHILKSYDIELCGLYFDAMIADYLISAANTAKTLAELCKMHSLDEKSESCAMLQAMPKMLHTIEESGMGQLFFEVEMPLVSVLFDMEKTGFCVDKQILYELGKFFTTKKAELEGEIYKLCGCEFNILSPKQLSTVLFETLKLPPPGSKTAQGYYSTAADVLDELATLHPAVGLITEYRFISKLKGTYIDGMVPLIVPETGRIHTTFNQNVSTGRISSAEPNLQNIPVRTELGREIRRAFVSSSGNTLADSDYSQIELRVLASMSGDETMINIFCSGGDIHTQTAAEVFSVPAEDVTREQRSAAKAVNFGIVYGISDFGLAKNLGISRGQAKRYIELYLSRFTRVSEYMKTSIDTAKKCGYATTILGRRRELPELRSSNYHTRSFGERVARNMPIQGSAADIIKLAMVAVHNALKENGLTAKLVLQIHDELIIDAPESELSQVRELLQSCMQNVLKLSVPLTCEVNTGKSWYDTK